ncbi:MAG: 50S ribosomal protein L29 [Chloroflexota bacterium]|nr:50S ribosomal protein L29 [Chloroflexota bacterium]
MDAAQLRTMDDPALQKQLDDLYQELFNLRFQRAAGQMPNFNRLGEVKRDIARIKTVLSERARAAKVAQHATSGEEAKAQ